MRAKADRLRVFNNTTGMRSTEAAAKFRKEQEEAQKEERMLRQRQMQVRTDENRM